MQRELLITEDNAQKITIKESDIVKPLMEIELQFKIGKRKDSNMFLMVLHFY
jgi:hypothetical protein